MHKRLFSCGGPGDPREALARFFEMGARRRASMGIVESLIRVSVGIEDTADLLEGFKAAL